MVGQQAFATISNWFKQVQYADLKLPDGWFGGRPYENCHQLTFMELRPHKLLLELDNQLLLVFTDVNTVRVEGSELVLTDFAQLVLD